MNSIRTTSIDQINLALLTYLLDDMMYRTAISGDHRVSNVK